jgi:hypothetical protein
MKYGLRSYVQPGLKHLTYSGRILPDGEKFSRIPGLVNAKLSRELYQDGVFGGPYQVDDKIMEEVFAAALEDILQLLKFE